jgi:hypothetical protein
LLTKGEVLKDIEREDELWNEARRKKPARPAKLDPISSEISSLAQETSKAEAKPKVKTNAPPGFY